MPSAFFRPEIEKPITDFVYEGVWEKYGENLLQTWIWTLSDLKALFLLGGFGLLLTLSQSRSWVLIRYIICLKKRAVRLNANDPEPLQHLSQAKAILDILPFFVYQFSRFKALAYRLVRLQRHHPNTEVTPDSSIISPLFGLFATINVCFFIIMSVALPWRLSEGTLGKALVRSRMTNECQNGTTELWGSIAAQRILETDANFRTCYHKSKQACGDNYYLQQPQITRRRKELCIFSAEICYNETKPFEITHWNITAHEVGLNLKSKVMLNHRLTCAPIHLDPFLYFDKTNNSPKISLYNFRNERGFDSYRPGMELPLKTMNGPNSLSAENSGCRVWKEHRPTKDISILPHNRNLYYKKLLRDELVRDDGASFLLIYRPGRTEYSSQVDDPFFAAHYNLFPGRYLPDNEATALGCLEQFQYHTPIHNFYSSWGEVVDSGFEVKKYLDEKKDYVGAQEVLELGTLTHKMSIQGYLIDRILFSANTKEPMPLTPEARSPQLGHSTKVYTSYLDHEQWIAETEAWFFTGLVGAFLYIQNGARSSFEVQSEGNGHRAQAISCDRVLFWDENYTNISWVGFWITTVLFTILCIASFAVRWLDATTRSAFRSLVVIGKLLLEKLVFMAGLLGWWLWSCFPSWRSVRDIAGRNRSGSDAVKIDGIRTSGDFVHLGDRTPEEPGI